MRNKAQCHPTKVNHSNGLCLTCYTKEWRIKNREKYHAQMASHYAKHKKKINANWKHYYRLKNSENTDWNKNRTLKHLYGISLAQYNELAAQQERKCLICECLVKTLHVDHDHNTNAIRGLLCGNCNTAIGLFKEDPAIISRAIQYLRMPQEIHPVISITAQ